MISSEIASTATCKQTMASTDAEMQRLSQCAPGERLMEVRRGDPQVIGEQLVTHPGYPGYAPGYGPAAFGPAGWHASGNESDYILPYKGDGYVKGADVKELYWNGAVYRQQQTVDEREHLVGVEYDNRHVVSEHVTGQFNKFARAVKSTYLMEKVVEQPVTIVKEREVEVKKPEIIERIVRVPKVEIRENTRVMAPEVVHQEQIVEVPQVAVEERVLHKPKHVVQERLIEVPKYEFVEKIEYIDYVEYREVPVDKIVEVPEVEYRVREVEKFIPQTFVEEYYVDNYVDVPMTQVQEVERIERVAFPTPPCDCDVLMKEIAESQAARAKAEAEMLQLRKEIASLRAGMVRPVTVVSPVPTPPTSCRQVRVVQPVQLVQAPVQAVQYVPQATVRAVYSPPSPTPPGTAGATLFVPRPATPTPPGSLSVVAARPAVATPPGSVSIVSLPATPPRTATSLVGTPLASERVLTYAAQARPSPPTTSPTAATVQPREPVAPCFQVQLPQLSGGIQSSYATYEPRSPVVAPRTVQSANFLTPQSGSMVVPASMPVASVNPAAAIFESLDRNHDGVISRSEFEQALNPAATSIASRPTTVPASMPAPPMFPPPSASRLSGAGSISMPYLG